MTDLIPNLSMGKVRLYEISSYMKRMGSDNEKARQGVWNETERYIDHQIQGFKSLKRQKSPANSFVLADELKRQYTYTLKPSKCSSTDVTEGEPTPGSGDRNDVKKSHDELEKLNPQQNKLFPEMSFEKIFVNSEYFKMKGGNNGRVSFCSGENGENRWTVTTNAAGKKTAPMTNDKPKPQATPTAEELSKPKKPTQTKKAEGTSQAEELKNLKENVEMVVREMKSLNRDFGLVRTDLKTIEKLLRLEKQVSKGRATKKDGEMEGINLKLGKFSEEVEKAAQELREFIDNNQTLLVEREESSEYPDFDKIINNLQRLSETAYQPKIIQTSKGAKFEVPRELPVTLYADGMLLRNAEFRRYLDVKARLFLKDIEDGFFPSELWPEYPCGVPFQVTDKRSEIFSEVNFETANSFPGHGCRLGSVFDGKPSSMVYLQPTNYLEMNRSTEKRSTNFTSTEQYKNPVRCKSLPGRCLANAESDDEEMVPRRLSLKVRLGMGKESCLNLSIMSDDKMSRFQDVLFRKLCQKFHNDFINENRGDRRGETVPDFEVHVYGRKPFRLSEKLSSHPSECGIFNNCVLNITEI